MKQMLQFLCLLVIPMGWLIFPVFFACVLLSLLPAALAGLFGFLLGFFLWVGCICFVIYYEEDQRVLDRATSMRDTSSVPQINLTGVKLDE